MELPRKYPREDPSAADISIGPQLPPSQRRSVPSPDGETGGLEQAQTISWGA